MSKSDPKKNSSWKRTFIEWGIIGAVALTLYLSGLHTEVIGTLQRGMLWTGFFDADTTEISTTDGPVLSDSDFSFAMLTSDDNRVSLDDFRGDLIFVNVWASWCPPCVAEMPTIETLYNRVGDYNNIRFVMLSMDQDRQKGANYMENKEFPMPYFFPASELPNMLQSQYLPTTYLISKEGKVIYKKEGIADYSSTNFAQWMINLAQK